MPQNNFPKFKPIVHYDRTSVPEQTRTMVRQSHNLRILTLICFVANLIAAISVLVSGVAGYGNPINLIIAILYLIFYPPAEFFVVHFVLYKAAVHDSSLRYVIYFVVQTMEIVFKIFLVVGIKDCGGGGIGAAIAMFDNKNIAVGVICLVNALLFIVNVVGLFVLIKESVSTYRSGGHSLQKARNEGIKEAAKNDTVRKAVVKGVV